jgi:hypothetical protein
MLEGTEADGMCRWQAGCNGKGTLKKGQELVPLDPGYPLCKDLPTHFSKKQGKICLRGTHHARGRLHVGCHDDHCLVEVSGSWTAAHPTLQDASLEHSCDHDNDTK